MEAVGRLLFAAADDAVLLVAPDGRIASANAAASALLGAPPARVLHHPASHLLRTPIPGEDPLHDALAEPQLERELMLTTPGAGDVPVRWRSWRVGRPPWRLIVLHDLTQARRQQEELRRHERLATLGQLSAGVAHEIRNPLAGIGTSAQVLLRRFEPRDERARFVRVILDEVSRLDRIVTSLLQYARPRTPKLEPGALVPCVERVRELSADALREAGVTVEVDVQPRLPEVWIDADLVTQVLLNVTLNAVQAMSGGGTLRYEIRRVRRRRAPRGPGRRASDAPAGGPGGRSAQRWVELQQVRVIDSGAGIARGVMDKLFDPFFSTKPRGTGLGLSISQTIMQEHGGSIEVASREGRGTTVMLNFPVEKRHGQRRTADAHAESARAADRG
ncbi:MAG TPA: ATP-binding protein [Candidatus Eisenbacteria bacterium]|nr:ATP-binding protein [Candidatus Eisenbacteria bacterium]